MCWKSRITSISNSISTSPNYIIENDCGQICERFIKLVSRYQEFDTDGYFSPEKTQCQIMEKQRGHLSKEALSGLSSRTGCFL